MTMSVDALYEDLLLDLNYPKAEYHPWDSPSTVAKSILASTFLKKFQDTVDLKVTNKVALDKFLSVNERCGAWELKKESLLDDLLVGQFLYWTHKFFDGNGTCPLVTSFNHVFECGRMGPGASIGTSQKDFYSKLFDSKLTSTSVGLHRAYAAYISQFPLWVEAEVSRTSLRGIPDVVVGNRLSFVAKDVKTSRTICTEPVLNMFCQLGVGRILEERLKQVFHIDVATQPDVNRALAQHGSLYDDLVTIDLSSASDSLATRMIDWCIPSSFTQWLHLFRSPVSKVPGVGDVQLNMISTMGNGFTFPLQTALFCCVVAACMDIDSHPRFDNQKVGSWPRRSPNWGVFGDDIIVPKRVISKVRRLLQILGFVENSDKTFLDGPFRESCGFDAFKGVNVRGVYVKTLKRTQDRYSVINRLLQWVDRHGIPLPRTIAHLLRSVPRIVVPAWENEESGIRLPDYITMRLFRRRKTRNGSLLYRRFVARSTSLRVDVDGEIIRVPRGHKAYGFNPNGLYLSFLAGYLEGCEIRVKPDLVNFSLRTGVAPNWDHHPTVPDTYSYLGGGGVGHPTPLLMTIMRSWT